ncbi:hypothetical protein SLEP1_g24643 [Rubroshorea leprosula]|uniref:Transposase n=1 Tax=Rubroshorea leprosula TaxID=152421 RepID=A0AAV5JLM2_9ROSI|nr:hypothetical protein SLEP1_g24643 [Rubroshorea leprosula]
MFGVSSVARPLVTHADLGLLCTELMFRALCTVGPVPECTASVSLSVWGVTYGLIHRQAIVLFKCDWFIEIHAKADVGEGTGEEDEEGEWEDFETSEEENIETYVEENDSSDDSHYTEAVESTQPLQRPNPFDPQRRVQEEIPTDVVLETPASDPNIQAESSSDEDTPVATPQSDDRLWSSCGRISQMLTHRGDRIKFKHALSELKAKCAKRSFQVKPPDMNLELWARLVYLWTKQQANPEGCPPTFPKVYTNRRQHKGKGKDQLPIYCNDEAQETGEKLTAKYAARQKEEGFDPIIAHGELLLRATGGIKKGWLKSLDIHTHPQDIGIGPYIHGQPNTASVVLQRFYLAPSLDDFRQGIDGFGVPRDCSVDVYTIGFCKNGFGAQEDGVSTSKWQPFRPPIIGQSNRVIELEQTVESLKEDNNSLRQSQMTIMADTESLRQQQLTLAAQMQTLPPFRDKPSGYQWDSHP